MTVRYVCIKPSGYTLDASESSRYSAEYTSMSGAEAAENGAFSDDLYIDILHGDATYNWDGTDDTTVVNWVGWDCTAGAKVIVRTLTAAQSANSTSSRPDFSGGSQDLTEYRLYTSGFETLRFINTTTLLDIEFLGVQVERHTIAHPLVENLSNTALLFEKCWLKTNVSDYILNINATNSHPFKTINCVMDGAGVASRIGDFFSETALVNCTMINAVSYGIVRSGTDTTKVTNCIIADTGDNFFNIWTGNLNASDDQDGPGTDIGPSGSDWVNEVGVVWTDLRPLNTGNIYLAGEIQNNDSDIPSDDIAGNPRPTGASAPTIGAFEYVSGDLLPINLIDGKIIIKNSTIDLLDGKVQVKDVNVLNLDGKIIVQSDGVGLLDGKVQIKDIATDLLDGKIVIGTDISNLFDGKVQIKDTVINLLDGKVVINAGDVVYTLLDGKVQIKFISTDLLDGLIVISNNNVDLLDGKLIVKQTGTSLLDGKIQIKDITTDLLDGKITIKTDALNLLDGKVVISSVDIGLLDGKCIVKDSETILLDGKLVIVSDAAINLLDGKIIIRRGFQGVFTVTFEIDTPSMGYELSVPSIDFEIIK